MNVEKSIRDIRFMMVVLAVAIMLVFWVLAMDSDRLNARIRELEIRAGMGDKWAEKK